jgi:hypothetical protein
VPGLVGYPTDRWLEALAYRGHDGMRELAAAFSDNFDEWTWEVHDIRDTQDLVVAAVTMTARNKNSDSPISQPLGLVVSELHDGAVGARARIARGGPHPCDRDAPPRGVNAGDSVMVEIAPPDNAPRELGRPGGMSRCQEPLFTNAW